MAVLEILQHRAQRATEHPQRRLSELQGIGASLTSLPPYDLGLAEVLRADLGDWRNAIAWPDRIFTDPIARTEFYSERGLDLRLTAFPSAAFEESSRLAGLRDPTPPLLDIYNRGQRSEEDDDEQEEGYQRANAAHDRLQRLESQLRNFIEERMTSAVGSDWIKHRVPSPMRESWVRKQEKARAPGEPERRLIAFADFTDYVQIITKRDNWRQVFEPVFQRREFVTESFQRLYPIRICTMHARPTTQDDELYLLVEAKRLLKAIALD